jgi:hypothetical protein
MSTQSFRFNKSRSAKPFGGWRVGRLCWSLLFASAFLIAQHGASVHSLSHFFERDTGSQSDQHHSPHHQCPLCLAFAQIAGGVAPVVVAPQFADNPSFEPAIAASRGKVANDLPSRRNRGPPAFL